MTGEFWGHLLGEIGKIIMTSGDACPTMEYINLKNDGILPHQQLPHGSARVPLAQNP